MKLARRVTDEIRKRKKNFSQYSVANLQMYRRVSGKSLPDIIFALDNYDAVKGNKLEGVVDSLLQLIAREGASLGLYLTMTVARFGVLKPNLAANLKRRISLKLTDDNETRTVIGRNEHLLESIPGRGLIALEEAEVFQIFLPAKGGDSVEVVENLQAEAIVMDNSWTGSRPKGIPVVPEQMSMEQFLAMAGTKEAIHKQVLPIGLDFETVEVQGFSMKTMLPLMVMSDKDRAKQAVFRHLLGILPEVVTPENIIVYDLLDEYEEQGYTSIFYKGSESDYSKTVEKFKQLIKTKKQEKDISHQFIVISDVPSLLSMAKMTDKDFSYLFEEGAKVGLHLIYGVSKSFMNSTSSVQQYLKNRAETALLAMKVGDQGIFPRSSTNRETVVPTDEVFLHVNDVQIRLKITRRIEDLEIGDD